MIKLSYSRMNQLINAPHTWLNYMAGLPTFTTHYFEEGKVAHRLIQDHVSGVGKMMCLEQLPTFSMVETVDFDPKMHVEYKINDKYLYHGYVDGLDPEGKRILEIKSGARWSVGDFFRTPQWRLYSLASPTYTDVYLVNVPRNPDEWNPRTVKIYTTTVTAKDHDIAKDFIEDAIYTIENLKDALDKEIDNRKPGRSRYCFYENCPFCNENIHG